MKKLIVVIFLTSIIALGEQQAITDNGVIILLKDNGTWEVAAEYMDSIVKAIRQHDSIAEIEIASFATTKDNQGVVLKDSTWEFVSLLDSSGFIEKIKTIKIVPYHRIEIKPKLIRKPPMMYPEEVKDAGIEGTVVVKMLVDIDGTVIETKVLRSSGNYILDQAALEAAERALFKPATQDGVPVRVWVSMPFRYKLPGCSGCIF